MATVAEHVKQGAREDEQVRQESKRVSPVLGEQKEPGNRSEAGEHPPRAESLVRQCVVIPPLTFR